MPELMYGLNSVLIAVILLGTMLIGIELGTRAGMAAKRNVDEAGRSQVNSIQASLLGVLALLLGFTFSLALQRYDARSNAVVEEANAIGTAYLRAQLLPESVRDDSLALFRDYVDSRLRTSAVSLDQVQERAELVAESNRIANELWRLAVLAAEERPGATLNLYLQSLNETIDAFSARDAVLDRHVPEIVLMLLYLTFVLTGVLVGYASGITGHRTSFATYILIVLIVMLVFIIIDLDRPRRGLIEVSQQNMLDLQASMVERP